MPHRKRSIVIIYSQMNEAFICRGNEYCIFDLCIIISQCLLSNGSHTLYSFYFMQNYTMANKRKRERMKRCTRGISKKSKLLANYWAEGRNNPRRSENPTVHMPANDWPTICFLFWTISRDHFISIGRWGFFFFWINIVKQMTAEMLPFSTTMRKICGICSTRSRRTISYSFPLVQMSWKFGCELVNSFLRCDRVHFF